MPPVAIPHFPCMSLSLPLDVDILIFKYLGARTLIPVASLNKEQTAKLALELLKVRKARRQTLRAAAWLKAHICKIIAGGLRHWQEQVWRYQIAEHIDDEVEITESPTEESDAELYECHHSSP